MADQETTETVRVPEPAIAAAKEALRQCGMGGVTSWDALAETSLQSALPHLLDDLKARLEAAMERDDASPLMRIQVLDWFSEAALGEADHER